MKLALYNTLSRKKEEFTTLKKGSVKIYTCGPTVYDFAHIGNLRTYIFEGVLIRVLLANGYKVKHVINITDIGHLASDADEGEDKMIKALRRENLPFTPQSMQSLADKYTRAFKRDIAALNIFSFVSNPKYTIIWAKATDHIKEQIRLIKKLEAKGYAYETKDGVYFDTSKLKDYGKLTNQKLEDLQEGARVEKNPNKKNPTDFSLWLKNVGEHKNHVMKWKSPWGAGFPGWHIECSAMAMKHLGKTMDIHTGGIDHIAVHHTNEIAQSEAATGKPFSKFWMHGVFLVIDDKKMAKSAGTFITLEDVTKKGFTPMDYRYLCLTAHYRTPLGFSWETLEAAKNARANLIEQLGQIKTEGEVIEKETDKFLELVNNDLDMPRALAHAWQLLKSKKYKEEDVLATVFAYDEILGLDLRLGWKQARDFEIPEEVQKLVDIRETARKDKNWKKSDELRDQIEKKGFLVEDSSNGPKIKAKK